MNFLSFMDWSSRRRLFYILFLILAVFALVFYNLYPYLNPIPTCNDKKMNGIELGVDCGGACSLQCKNTYIPLKIGLEKIFANGSDKDLFVVFENDNNYIAPYIVKFDLEVMDSSGVIIETIKKEVVAGTQKKIPVLISKYKNKDAYKLVVKNLEYEMYTTRGSAEMALSDFDMSEDNTKLNVKIRNVYKGNLAQSFRVYLLLKNINDEVIGINYQDVSAMRFEEVKNLYFLWAEPLQDNVHSVDLITISNLYR